MRKMLGLVALAVLASVLLKIGEYYTGCYGSTAEPDVPIYADGRFFVTNCKIGTSYAVLEYRQKGTMYFVEDPIIWRNGYVSFTAFSTNGTVCYTFKTDGNITVYVDGAEKYKGESALTFCETGKHNFVIVWT